MPQRIDVAKTLSRPTAVFDVAAHGGRWYSWKEMTHCFWPRHYCAGHTSVEVDAVLARVRDQGGVYLLATGEDAPATLRPTDPAVIYVGETGWFQARLGQFGDSAGLWGGEGVNGHSAGWRYTGGDRELWVALFRVDAPLGKNHLAIGLRKWLEAVALEEHDGAHGHLPHLNDLTRDR